MMNRTSTRVTYWRVALLLAMPLAMPLAASVPTTLHAQVTVEGVVLDSLRGGFLAGAVVRVDGGQRQAVADAEGRFTLGDLPLEALRLVIQSPYLDSIGLGPIRTRVAARAGTVAVTISTISLAAFQRAVCGTELPLAQSIMVGNAENIWGDPQAYFQVAAIWEERIQRGRRTVAEPLVTVDTTDGLGAFVLCGVPRQAEFRMGAGTDSLGTQPLAVVGSGDPVWRYDLLIGERNRSVAARGRVLGADGRPLQGTVEIFHDSTSLVRVAADGSFRVALPQRSAQLRLRAPGHAPKLIDLRPTTQEVDLGDVRLAPERPSP